MGLRVHFRVTITPPIYEIISKAVSALLFLFDALHALSTRVYIVSLTPTKCCCLPLEGVPHIKIYLRYKDLVPSNDNLISLASPKVFE